MPMTEAGELEEGPDTLKDTWSYYRRSMAPHNILWPLLPFFLLSLDFL